MNSKSMLVALDINFVPQVQFPVPEFLPSSLDTFAFHFSASYKFPVPYDICHSFNSQFWPHGEFIPFCRRDNGKRGKRRSRGKLYIKKKLSEEQKKTVFHRRESHRGSVITEIYCFQDAFRSKTYLESVALSISGETYSKNI